MYEYNSSRGTLVLREYGRNIQKMIRHISAIDDKTARTQQAQTLLRLMGALDNSNKSEHIQKRWNDLLAMSEYKLEIDNPHPITQRKFLDQKPQQLDYATTPVKFRKYGRNVERLTQKAINTTNPAVQTQLILAIIRLMKHLGSSWNGEKVDCDTILAHLQHLSAGKLTISREQVMDANIFQYNSKDKSKSSRITNSKKRK